MKKVKIIIVIFILIILSYFLYNLFCKDEQNLGEGYYFLPDYEAVDIGYSYGNMIYKSNQKNHFNNILVRSDIKYINFDNQYVIVLQEPNKALILKQINDDLELWNNYYLESNKDSLVSLVHKKMRLIDIHNLVKNKKEKLNIIVDSIFNNEIFYKKMFQNKSNYYIIQKANDSLFGPLTLKEFEIIKNKKSIELNFDY